MWRECKCAFFKKYTRGQEQDKGYGIWKILGIQGFFRWNRKPKTAQRSFWIRYILYRPDVLSGITDLAGNAVYLPSLLKKHLHIPSYVAFPEFPRMSFGKRDSLREAVGAFEGTGPSGGAFAYPAGLSGTENYYAGVCGGIKRDRKTVPPSGLSCLPPLFPPA